MNAGAATHTAAPLRALSAKTLSETLVDEVERVAILRERHRRLGEDVGNIAGFASALALMTFAIDAAKRAVGEGELVAMIAAYRELRGFDDE